MADNMYIESLLTGVAADHSIKAREELIGDVLFPIVKVAKPTGLFYTYSKEQAYKIIDDTMSETGEAKELKWAGDRQSFFCTPRGNKTFINNDEERFKEGPFVKADLDFVKDIITNIERNREKRIIDKVLNLPSRNTTLTGTGTAKTNKWANGQGNPYDAIKDAINLCFYRPNILVLSRTVLDALEVHAKLLDKLGEANMIKKVNIETLQKLFDIEKVVIAEGRGDSTKQDSSGSINPTLFWGNNVVLAYADSRPNVPCAGKTFMVNYTEADGNGYVVRKWDEPRNGILGGHTIQVACNMDEFVISNDLIYAIKEVL